VSEPLVNDWLAFSSCLAAFLLRHIPYNFGSSSFIVS
jgi:hypothetical protein